MNFLPTVSRQQAKEALIYVGEAVSTRQKQAKKRSLCLITEHFEPVFNAVMTTQVINQRFLRCLGRRMDLWIAQLDAAAHRAMGLSRVVAGLDLSGVAQGLSTGLLGPIHHRVAV